MPSLSRAFGGDEQRCGANAPLSMVKASACCGGRIVRLGGGRVCCRGMSVVTLIGIAAGTLTTVSFAPQVVKSWRTRHTKDVSMGMFSVMSVGVTLWLVYGILLHDLPMILANSVTLCLAGSMLALKIRFG